jgi:DNA polymerase III subunit alpha
MVTAAQKKTTKTGKSMAIVTLADMEAETTIVIFPKLFEECAEALRGEVDEETGETVGDVFIQVRGKLERSDRGDQVIAQSVEPLILNDATNRPKVLEVNLPNSMLSRGHMETLDSMLVRYPGLDHVELRVEAATGDMLCFELPCKVDAHNMVLLAEVSDFLGHDGKVIVA